MNDKHGVATFPRTVAHSYMCLEPDARSGGETVSRRGRDQTKFSARDLLRRLTHAMWRKARTPLSIVTSSCNIAESTETFTADRFLCSVGERTCPVRRTQTKAHTDQPRLGPISHVNKQSPSSLHQNHYVHRLKIHFREEGVTTSRLLPCSRNSCVSGFSPSISESRKDAFVKIAPGVSICCPYKGVIHGLSISRQLPSISQGTQRIIPLTKQCKGAFSPCARGNELIDPHSRTLSTNEMRK